MREKLERGWRVAEKGIGFVLILLLGCLVAAPGAQAGPARYVVEACDAALPGGGTEGTRFVVNPGVPLSGFNECGVQGGAIGVAEHGHVEANFAFWKFGGVVPSVGKPESLAVEASACNIAPANTAFVVSSGWPASACGVEQLRRFGTGGVPFSLPSWIELGCDGNKGSCEAGAIIYARHLATTLVDPVAPEVSTPTGPLVSGGVKRGHQALSVAAKDKGGGLTKISVLVNGVLASPAMSLHCNLYPTENESVSGLVATVPGPCPPDTSAEWNLDTQVYPFHDGANRLETCATDFASLSEPNTTCSPPQSVEVDNSCPSSAVDGGDQLSAGFAADGSESLVVGYGQGAKVAGRLRDSSGDPVPGATLCVSMQTAGVEARAALVGSATTDGAGHYSYRVAPGPNREVSIAYRHDSKQVARSVSYFAHARPSLRLGPRRVDNGEAIRIWGTLPGPAQGGHVVVLQASALGSDRWLTFRKATSRADGRFRARYRFNGTHRRSVYRIRAVVPTQTGYPWVAGQSKPARVVVAG